MHYVTWITHTLFGNLEETAGVSDFHISGCPKLYVIHWDDKVWNLNSSVLLLCYAVCHSDDILCHLKGTVHISIVKNVVSEKFTYAIPSAVLLAFMVVCGMFSMPFLSKMIIYGSAEGPPRGVENRNLLSHPDDLKMEAYVTRMT